MKHELEFNGRIAHAKLNEPFERTLKRFKSKVQESGVLQDLQKKEFYEKPTTKRKRKKAAAKNRWNKILRSQQLPTKDY